MKQLFLVRHARAENMKEGMNDFSRILLKEGIQDAKNISRKIKLRVNGNTIFLSSPANRALETAHIFAQKLHYPAAKILLHDSLYNDSTNEDFFELIRGVDDSYDTAFVFGHNPALNILASSLLKGFEFNIPKSGVVAFEFDTNFWEEIDKQAVILMSFKYPFKKAGKAKDFEKTVTSLLSREILDVFSRINPVYSKEMRKSVEKQSYRLSRRFIKELNRKTHEKTDK